MNYRKLKFLAPVLWYILFPYFAFFEFVLALFSTRFPAEKQSPPRVIVITGASSGLGAALALHCANHTPPTSCLVLCARRSKELNEIGDQCRLANNNKTTLRKVICKVTDVTNRDQFTRTLVEIGREFGSIDVAVFNMNAGASIHNRVSDSQATELHDKIMQVNYSSVVCGVMAALPYVKTAETLLKTGRKGQIIVVGSMRGFIGEQGASAYCASKFAVKGFCDALRMEERNVHVSVIYPDVLREDRDLNGSELLVSGSPDLPEASVASISRPKSQVMSATEAAELVFDVILDGSGTRDAVLTFEGNLLWFLAHCFPRVRDVIVNRIQSQRNQGEVFAR